MSRKFGTVGHFGSTAGLMAAVLVASMKRKPARRTPPTAAQIAAADKRSERQRWNDEVDARKAAKREARELPP